ncbi:MAG: hypothetical protein CL610_03575 [Anaerolineaceae bacterium]|nr:hypothetical protein [Anaerolineaceae bacterium]
MSEIYLPPQPTEDDAAPQPDVNVEDLTLADLFGRFWRSPGPTLRALRQVASVPRSAEARNAVYMPPQPQSAPRRLVQRQPLSAAKRREAVQLGMRFMAFILAWWGCGILASTPQRTEITALNNGAPYLVAGFVLWLAADIYGSWPQLRAWWQRRRNGAASAVELDEDVLVEEDIRPETQPVSAVWMGLHPTRVLIVLSGFFLSLIVLPLTANNQFTFLGFWTWIASIVLWVIALAPVDNGPLLWVRSTVQAAQRIRWRSGTMLALVLIMLLGAVFRLSDLNRVPPEMTSDHVEKILDSYGVLQGQHNIFFANNGGREPFQMYAMAVFSQLPGLGMNHFTLKFLSAVEGLVAIVLMYWMGREVVGTDNRRLGRYVGLLLAALVAASYWHTALSRLGLRIVLTTVVTAVLMVFLARAMRHNRREDFIKAGLVLGFGLYTYQAVRMLPVVVIAGVGLAFLFHAHSWRVRWRYAINFVVLVLVALVVFMPLLGYWMQYPNDFWRRTQGRFFGDALITTVDAEGKSVERNATLQERLDAFSENLPILTNNIRAALLMFNWKGDVAWINGSPNEPAMDTLTGALLIIGLAAWLVRMVRKRDIVDWLVPLALLIMLMPSALSIAYPVENPSHTRTSGALPEAYLIAALPLALMVESITKLAPGRRGVVVAGGLAAVVVLGAYSMNARTFFVGHYDAYIDSSLPYTEAGRILRGFAESDGSYGNAYMVGYRYWWDHRALGIEAGHPDWPNGIVSMDGLKDFLFAAYEKTGDYRLDPEKDLLFFLAPEDEDSLNLLREYFPDGRATLRMSYQGDDEYWLYRVPALGEQGFLSWLASPPIVAGS